MAPRLERGGRGLQRRIDLHDLRLVGAGREHGALGPREGHVGEGRELRRGVGALARLEKLVDLPGAGVGLVAGGEPSGRLVRAPDGQVPLVRGVVGLAPWFPEQEPVDPIVGKDLVALHGRADSVTRYAETEALLERAAGVASHVEMVDMGQRGHTMMDGLRTWNATVRRQVLAMFLR